MSKSSKQETLFPVSPVLIVDDERAVLESMSSLLHSAGINNTLCCEDSRQVPGILQERDVEVIVLDLAMPHLSGQELLLLIKARFPHVPVIIVTAMDEVQTAVECMKAGAFEYIVKTAEESKLIVGVKRAVEIRRLKREFSELRTKLLTDRLAHPEAFAFILTRSRRMQSVFLFVESIAKSSEPVLITGETGVGKNMIARALHEVSGRTGPYVEVNVAGLDDTMFADTLFGHRRGAFTGAMADREGLIRQARGGTLLLDEIGDLTGQSQIKLLSVLDTRVYYPLGSDVPHRTDARFVIATNRDLNDLIGSERFRKDLYYRLSTHAVHIPPLRERREDLPVLLEHFLDEASRSLSKKKLAVSAELLPLLATYHFPGNIRELRAMVYDAVGRQTERMLPLTPFRQAIGRSVEEMPIASPDTVLSFGGRLPTIKQATDLLIEEALRRAEGNQSLAAGLLGISHQALNKRIRHNLYRKPDRG